MFKIVFPTHLILLSLLAVSLVNCTTHEPNTLPFLGRHKYTQTPSGIDTVYHSISEFAFTDQDSSKITNANFDGKIYVADFFFTTCPSICPITTAQMLRIYTRFKNDTNVLILSHTIDPEYDQVPVLKEYADRLDVSSDKWHFVTGNKDSIYNMAQNSYYARAGEDPGAPGGFVHSGAFALIDRHRHIRGIYDGTKPKEVDKLMKDMVILMKEK